MEVTEQEKQRINEIYFALSTKQAQLFHGLYHRIFQRPRARNRGRRLADGLLPHPGDLGEGAV